ncbi:proline--tRNA ligase [Candidatus Endowatersipora endosymbiont of Watersipora subatra]|uniref:proline--tRNA ligase n=1 Tax=Candidatus Endowatersipora endosymbiont of Watersipora subatra TaxID=3077946 RepID=UPI00312CAEAA
MYLSKYFLPALKEAPREAEIISHQLMLRAGMIKQQSVGIYSWLPLGLKVMRKVENIIREEQNRAGAVELLMPSLQSADLWHESKRYDDYGKEMIRIYDRYGREILLGPTNEEMVTDIFRSYVHSYKDLPLNLYHMQWKFRDEVRPRFGVMRGREFRMKDAYSFDFDEASSRTSYYRMFTSYLRIFDRLGIKTIPIRAHTGPIGGDLSHEFLICADTGESKIFCDKDYLSLLVPGAEVDYSDDLLMADIFNQWNQLYARTHDLHDEALWSQLNPKNQLNIKGIEVGHIFHFGTKYSKPMGAEVMGPDGKKRPVFMGSYGIGTSRLVAALIEACHDKKGIIWPESVAPFDLALINLRVGDKGIDATCSDLYTKLLNAGFDLFYDDIDRHAGEKFALADLIGLPWQMIIGPRLFSNDEAEIKNRSTGEREILSLEAALNKLFTLKKGESFVI